MEKGAKETQRSLEAAILECLCNFLCPLDLYKQIYSHAKVFSEHKGLSL